MKNIFCGYCQFWLLIASIALAHSLYYVAPPFLRRANSCCRSEVLSSLTEQGRWHRQGRCGFTMPMVTSLLTQSAKSKVFLCTSTGSGDGDGISSSSSNSSSSSRSSSSSSSRSGIADNQTDLKDGEEEYSTRREAVSASKITYVDELASSDTKNSDMPWSQLQDWALRDQLSRYTVVIPIQSTDGSTKHEVYTLWRTMSHEVVELAGYSIDFLQDMHMRQIQRNVTSIQSSSGALPFLDEYEFESSGGLSGRVYGVRGVADGTRIVTSPVGNVKATVPKGFVLTEDGSVAYELGNPLEEQYSLDGTTRKLAPFLSKTVENVGAMSKNVAITEEDPDSNLVRLGGLTAILLGGSLAVDMLSHHLTVNVFWV